MRQENLDQTSITGRIDGKRARGRQRYNYLDQSKTFALMPPRPGLGMALNDDEDDDFEKFGRRLFRRFHYQSWNFGMKQT